MEPVAWSLRRLHCPVNKDDLVLEVGSGGSPYFRANVLCEPYEVTQERFFAPLVHDRPMICAFAENMPFKDESFDFVIASHVLEHSKDPDKFIEELQRVSKAGYIEVPDAFMERLTHYPFHYLEITDKDGELIIRKKKDYIQDEEVVDLFHNKARPIFPKWAAKFPFNFHVRYYWEKSDGGIKYRILNPEFPIEWEGPQLEVPEQPPRLPFIASLKSKVLKFVRSAFSQNSRNQSLDLLNLLQCTQCGGDDFKLDGSNAVCTKCKNSYSIYLSEKKEKCRVSSLHE